MSQETVKAFYDAVTKDQDLQKNLQAISGNISNKEDALKELIAFAGKKGYQFTAADLEAFEKSHAQKLSADDLDKVNAAGMRALCIFIGGGWGQSTKSGAVACRIIGLGFGGIGK